MIGIMVSDRMAFMMKVMVMVTMLRRWLVVMVVVVMG